MLVGNFFAPPLAPDDARAARAYDAVEAALGVRFSWSADRERQIATALATGRLAEAAGGDERAYVHMLGLPWAARAGSVAYVLLEISDTPPLITRASDAAAGLGRALAAYWGVVSPEASAATIAAQVSYPGGEPPPLGLPPLTSFRQLPHDVPATLGWLNYWSAATAQRLGFPDRARDGELLGRACPVDGGWLLQLTGEPLDLTRADHRTALAAAYQRFTAVGGRDQP